MEVSRLPLLSRRARGLVLAVVLLMQTVYFGLMIQRPIRAVSDNERYEAAAWNLASGRGYSLPLHGYGASNDEEIYGLVCSRHPEACYPDTTHPSALYMPGYPIALSGVYRLFGHSLVAAGLSGLVLLWALFAVFEQLAWRFLGRTGYLFAMAVAAAYPFLAHQAALIMSDNLHAVLWVSSLAALMLMQPGPARGVLFGGLMSLATLCRPYSMFVFPVMWGLALVGKAIHVHRREWLAGAVAFAIPFAIWTARNAYWFGHFLPFTTGGCGAQLYASTLEMDVDMSDPKNSSLLYADNTEKFGDVCSRRANQELMNLAVERMKEHPLHFAARIITHVPRLWVSMGTRYWPLMVLYLGGLFVLGLLGAWTVRRDPRFYPLMIAIAVNWAFLLPFPGESRRTLPMRLPMLVLAGMFAGPQIERVLSRRSRLVTAMQ